MKLHVRIYSRGVVSLLALIIMATITSAALGSSVIVVRTLQESENLDEAVVATYAAESGLEQGLHVLRMSRKNNQSLRQGAVNTFQELNAPFPAARTVGSARWDRVAQEENKFVVPRLQPDESVSLDLFDPDAVNNPGIESLGIDWGNTCEFLELEVTLLGWQLSGGATVFDPVLKEKWLCNSSTRQCESIPNSATPYLNSIDGVNMDPNKQYRVSFKALPTTTNACAVQRLVVTPYSDPNGGSPVPIPARISMKSSGSFLKATQAVSASIPWRAPASNLLNFVIFSEESVTK
ncbi:MAG: hypothetical protein HY566_01600 [Candidatus Kerfeldbacteria bacterium]|nr:hypothetical protein [Candidatus Kerfeldbacteria bacterium]